MEIDNFKLIREKLVTCDCCDDSFWYLQILIRGKDGHTEPGVNGNNSNRLIKFYTIRGRKDLDKHEQEIKAICNAVNGRAYIHPTRRNFRAVADEMFRNFTETYISHNDIGLKSVYSTAAGKSYITSEKFYIVDLDGDDATSINVKKYTDLINGCRPYDDKDKVKFIVPTLHGKHLIVKPFDTGVFNICYPGIDVHKNNPTLLYYNSKTE